MLAAANAADNEGNNAALCGLWFIDKNKMRLDKSGWLQRPSCQAFIKLKAWLGAYFAGEKNLPSLPLAPQGTAFQQKVWELLLDIPYGETSTYGGIAKKITTENSANKNGKAAGLYARAVGNAVGRNPVSIIIPCHRVLGADGSLTGFAGGIERKRALLELEGTYTLSI
jgi:methylated-DNA-[protein]-cysteine S-methyltransferase